MIGGMKTTPTSILVIEDHPLMREALCAAIAAEPDLQVAEAGIEGMPAFRMLISDQHDVLFLACKPDVILLAMGNPGWEELQALKSLRDSYPEIPILALTSNEVPGQEQAALESGAHAVLTKAASRTEFLHTLRAIQTDHSSTQHNPEIRFPSQGGSHNN
jgi:DNA-binding NarL/FixJ family response regulator